MSTRKTQTSTGKGKRTTSTAKAKPATAKAVKVEASTSKPLAKGVSNTPSIGTEVLRKKELIEKVVKRSGIKKKDAKPVVEAMLAELGVALNDHRDMALPPLGRIKINRSKPLPNGQVSVVKVRQKSPTVKMAVPATVKTSGT